MLGRYVISIVTGVAITLSLLFVMQLLIATGKTALTKPRERAQLDFVRVKRNVTVTEPCERGPAGRYRFTTERS